MSLNEIFQDQYPKGNRMPKNLRLNAREAATYLTSIPYEGPGDDKMVLPGRPGRGAGGESST